MAKTEIYNWIQTFRRNLHHGFKFKMIEMEWIVVDAEEVTPSRIVTIAPIINEYGELGKPRTHFIDTLVEKLASEFSS